MGTVTSELKQEDSAAEATAAPVRTPVSGGASRGAIAEQLLQRCSELGLTEAQAEELSALGLRAVLDLRDTGGGASASVGMRTVVVF